MATRSLDRSSKADRASRWAEASCLCLVRHWLALVNALPLVVVAGALGAPLLRAMGLTQTGDPLFASYGLLCHQLPERSFFVFGQQMAFCERDLAIFTSLAVGGIAFASVRSRIKPLPWVWLAALWLPMALDGFTQLAGFRESTWELRVLTGGLFGLSTAWALHPRANLLLCKVRLGLGEIQNGAAQLREIGS